MSTDTPPGEPYDPIPDLARLLCAAQRQGHPLPGLEFTLSHLVKGLDLPPLAFSDEAEVAIRDALAAVKADWHGPECEDEETGQ